MTTRDEGRPPDARQADALDAFLNDRVRGNPSPRTELDGSLVETVHRIQGLADATLAAYVSGAGEARTWEALMRDATSRPRLVAMPAIGATPTSEPVNLAAVMRMGRRPGAAAAFPSARLVPLGPAAPPSRLRRLGSQSLGLVATLTLVAMIGLSGLAVYLSAPRPNDRAGFPLLAGASPTADAESVPSDSHEIFSGPCDVTPRDYDELMAVISARILVPDPVAPASVASESGPFGSTGPRYRLPDGNAVSPDIRTELVGVLGSWTNCTPFLRTALSTDDYLIRYALEGPISGPTTVFWWRYSHPEDVPPAPTVVTDGIPPLPDPGDAELATSGASTDIYAYAFRSLGDERIAAYLASPLMQFGEAGSDSRPVGPPTYEESSYVVFARQPDGRWLVDEWQLSRRGVDTSCRGACATPIAP